SIAQGKSLHRGASFSLSNGIAPAFSAGDLYTILYSQTVKAAIRTHPATCKINNLRGISTGREFDLLLQHHASRLRRMPLPRGADDRVQVRVPRLPRQH